MRNSLFFSTPQFPSCKEVFSKTYPSFLTINQGGFSKINPSFFTIKEGSTSHLGLLPSGKKRKPLLPVALNRFAIRLTDHQRSRQVSYAGWDRLAESGGIRGLVRVVLAGMNPQGEDLLKLLGGMGPQG